MSIVGPRPNVASDVGLYTKEEMGLLSMRPGITDIASIVFSDEGEILKGKNITAITNDKKNKARPRPRPSRQSRWRRRATQAGTSTTVTGANASSVLAS